MELGLKGKVALVTGSGRGIGYAEAAALGAEGAIVAINDLDASNAEAACERLRATGVTTSCFVGDVTNEIFAASMVDRVVTQFGRIDILDGGRRDYAWA